MNGDGADSSALRPAKQLEIVFEQGSQHVNERVAELLPDLPETQRTESMRRAAQGAQVLMDAASQSQLEDLPGWAEAASEMAEFFKRASGRFATTPEAARKAHDEMKRSQDTKARRKR